MKGKIKELKLLMMLVISIVFVLSTVKEVKAATEWLQHPGSVNLEVGSQMDLNECVYTYKWANGYVRTYADVTFKSSNKNVASISNGILKANKKGTTTITAKSASKKVTFQVTVCTVEYTNNTTVQDLNSKIDQLLKETKRGKITKSNRFSLLRRMYSLHDEYTSSGVDYWTWIGDWDTGYGLTILPNYNGLFGSNSNMCNYANKFNPLSSKGKYRFKVSAVDATQKEVKVTLKNEITKDQIFALKATSNDICYSNDRAVSEKEAEVVLYLTNDKGTSYTLYGQAEKGKKSICFYNYNSKGKIASIKKGNYRAQWWPTSFKVNVKSAKKVGDIITEGNLKYKIISKNTVSCTAKNKKITSITIPETVQIEGKKYKVVEIQKNAFKSCSKLKKVYIGSNVKTINANAFRDCKKLKSITITRMSTKIGKNAFKNVNAKAIVCVPYKKLSTYKTSLRKSGLPKTANVTYNPIILTDSNVVYSYDLIHDYTGGEIKPAVTIIYKEDNVEKKLIEGVDYSLVYTNNIEGGTGNINVTFKGEYRGTKVLNFTIKKGVLLKFDLDKIIKNIGAQPSGTVYCKAYAMAYYRAVTEGVYVSWNTYWLGNQASGSSAIGCVSRGFAINKGDAEYYKAAIEELDAGRPCIMYFKQKGSREHWVLVVGYENSTDYSMDNFIYIDSIPRGGSHLVKNASTYYSSLQEGTGNYAGKYILVKK